MIRALAALNAILSELQPDGPQIVDAHLGGLQRVPVIPLILLHDEPARARVQARLHHGGNVLAAVAHRAELEGDVAGIGGRAIVLAAAVLADEGVGLLAALLAHVVLQVHDGRAAGILADERGRLLARVFHPAHVQLGLEDVLVHHVIDEIQAVLAADLHKLEIVVVIEQLDARLLAQAAEAVDVPQGFAEALAAGAVRLVQEGHGQVFAADGLVERDLREHVFGGLRNGLMAGNRLQAGFLQHGLHFLRGVAVKPGKFHAVVAQLRQLLQNAFEILRIYCFPFLYVVFLDICW